MARAKRQTPDSVAVTPFPERGGTATVKGKTYAVGMVWATPAEAGKIDASAKQAAKQQSADLICIRKPARMQFGLGSKATGHKAGMPPLASFLADLVEGNFVAGFELGDGSFYIVAVREGQILSGTDRVYGTREEAIDNYHDLFMAMDWTQAIAPSGWAIENTGGITLEDLIVGRPKSKLQAVSSSGIILKAIVVLVVLGLGYYGYSAYEQHQADLLEQQQEAAAAEAAREAADAARKRGAFHMPSLTWEGRMVGIPLIAQCQDAILAAPISVPGWDPIAIACLENVNTPPARETWNVALTLHRAGGTINWIAPALNHPGFKPSITQNSADTILVTWPLDTDADSAFDKTAATTHLASARNYITRQFEEVYQPVDMKDSDGQQVTVKGPNGKPQVVVLERHLDFSFKTAHDPKDYLRILAPIPVLAAASVQLDIASWTWTVQGTVYERMPLPVWLHPTPNDPGTNHAQTLRP
jgi:hypothetical protein